LAYTSVCLKAGAFDIDLDRLTPDQHGATDFIENRAGDRGLAGFQRYQNRLTAGNVPSIVFDVPKSSSQIDISTPGRSVRLHI
jgi:hypothetical protein